MSKVILDTSIIIGHLRGKSEDFKKLEAKRVKGEVEVFIPHIVITELFAGNEARRKHAREIIDKLIEGLEVVGLTYASAKKAGELIRKYPQIPDPFDFIIAAISMEHQARIATHNRKHFEQIKGLTLHDFPRNGKIKNNE